MDTTDAALAEEFTTHRAHLISVAYRLTGSVSDSEDAVQESWLRLANLTTDSRAGIADLKAWLTTVVGRLCLDKLRSATARRERYVGQWLPEPIVTPLGGAPGDSVGADPLEIAVRDDGVRMAAMVVLDQLGPQQRVAFVLHDAFGTPFAEIGEILGCSAGAARQHASRGRRAVAEADPPERADLAEQKDLLDRFVTAVLSGDVRAVAETLHPDVVLIGDGGGKGKTSRQVMVGADKITRFAMGLLRMYRPDAFAGLRTVLVNGDVGTYLPATPGGDGYHDLDTHVQTMAVRDGKIVAIYDHANPDKLPAQPPEPGDAGSSGGV